jgi:hypothetical protein
MITHSRRSNRIRFSFWHDDSYRHRRLAQRKQHPRERPLQHPCECSVIDGAQFLLEGYNPLTQRIASGPTLKACYGVFRPHRFPVMKFETPPQLKRPRNTASISG